MSQSDDFVTALRQTSVQAIEILKRLQALSTEASLLGYPANLVNAYGGDNANQSSATVTAAMAIYSSVLSALTADSNAGMLAIYNAAA